MARFSAFFTLFHVSVTLFSTAGSLQYLFCGTNISTPYVSTCVRREGNLHCDVIS